MPSSTGIPGGELLLDTGSRTVRTPHHRPVASLPASRAARSEPPAASAMPPAGRGSGGCSCPRSWNWRTRRYRWFRAIRVVRPGRVAGIHFLRTRSSHLPVLPVNGLSRRHAVENRLQLGIGIGDLAVRLDGAAVTRQLVKQFGEIP